MKQLDLFEEGDDYIVIQHPYAVFVEPGDVVDGKLQWLGKVIGHEFDNVVMADDPIEALEEVLALIKDLTTPPRYS